MNKIWIFIIVVSIIIGIANGKAPEMVNSIIESTKSATENSMNIIRNNMLLGRYYENCRRNWNYQEIS